jgi:hypothetical protein
MPVFNAEEFLQKWDEDNPEILVSDDIDDDMDNDWVLQEDEEEQLINNYFQSKESN